MDFYSEYQLPHGSRFINKLWVIDNSTQSAAIQNLKILPNGCFNIGLLIGQGAHVSIGENHFHFKSGIYLCAQLTQTANLTLLAASKVILIQIHPWYFSYYPKNDFRFFIDTISQSESNTTLFGQNIHLNSPTIIEDSIQITTQHINSFTNEYSQKNSVEKIATTILSHKGNCKISEILSHYDHSERWLQSRFKKATGLTPKQFAKIIQFRDSVDKITYDQTEDSLTSIGYRSGYNDQSHFVKSFRQFSDLTPSQFNPKNFVLSFKK